MSRTAVTSCAFAACTSSFALAACASSLALAACASSPAAPPEHQEPAGTLTPPTRLCELVRPLHSAIGG